MKSKQYILSVALLSLAPSKAIAAINGINLIGATPESRSLAGSGIARYSSAGQAIFQNPSLLMQISQKQVLGLSLASVQSFYSASVRDSIISGGLESGSKDSSYVSDPLPALYWAYRYSKKLVFGAGVFGYSGIGTNFANEATHLKLATEVKFARIPLSFAYQVQQDLSVAISVFALMGEVSVNHISNPLDPSSPQTDNDGDQQFAFGAQIGLNYSLDSIDLGLIYISSVKVTYSDVADFNLFQNFVGDRIKDDLTLEQPAELALGIKYKLTSSTDLTFDLRQVFYSSAAGYKDFDFEDQTILSLGVAHKLEGSIELMAGFNHGPAPIGDRDYDAAFTTTRTVNGTPLPRYSVAAFNALGLGVTTETTVGLGVKYFAGESYSLTGALTLSPEAKMVQQGTYLNPLAGGAPGSYRHESKLSLWSVTLGFDYFL